MEIHAWFLRKEIFVWVWLHYAGSLNSKSTSFCLVWAPIWHPEYFRVTEPLFAFQVWILDLFTDRCSLSYFFPKHGRIPIQNLKTLFIQLTNPYVWRRIKIHFSYVCVTNYKVSTFKIAFEIEYTSI